MSLGTLWGGHLIEMVKDLKRRHHIWIIPELGVKIQCTCTIQSWCWPCRENLTPSILIFVSHFPNCSLDCRGILYIVSSLISSFYKVIEAVWCLLSKWACFVTPYICTYDFWKSINFQMYLVWVRLLVSNVCLAFFFVL